MSEQLNIRPATEEDIPTLLQFIKDIAEFEKLAHMVEATEESLRQSLFSNPPAAEALFAEWDGEIAAFAVYFTSFSTFVGRPGLWLDDLFVKEQFRGKGIGGALLKHLAKIAVDRGCKRFEWIVLDWNKPAIDMYKKIGAEIMSEWQICRLSDEALKSYAS